MSKYRVITFFDVTKDGLWVNQGRHVLSTTPEDSYEGLREMLDDYLLGLKLAFYHQNKQQIINARDLWIQGPFRDQREDWILRDPYLVDGENVETIAKKKESSK